MTGFEFIEIASLTNLPPIIFTTAFSEYAVNAIGFLLKSVIAEELKAAIQKLVLASAHSVPVNSRLKQAVKTQLGLT